MNAYLILEDGSIFQGQSFGAVGQKQGEVVFSTAMGGYASALSDPSLTGQILVCTYPLIGNYGIDVAGQKKACLEALIVKEASSDLSSFRPSISLAEYLQKEGVPGLSGIDTRSLTRLLRNKGTMRGIVAAGDVDLEQLKQAVQKVPVLDTWAAVQKKAVQEKQEIPGNKSKLTLVDLGASQNLVQAFSRLGYALEIVPPTWKAEDILALNSEAVIIGNGPGNPEDLKEVIAEAAALSKAKPIWGVGLGCQVLALALGAKTFKMRYGHRGGNHPVKDLASGTVYVTAQTHGYAVDKDSLPPALELTQVNLNDATLEAFQHKELPLLGVQYHFENGSQDSLYLFDQFAAMLEQGGK